MTTPTPPAEPQKLAARIADHPLLAAYRDRMNAHRAWNDSEGGSAETDAANAAEAALVAALDADDQQRERTVSVREDLEEMQAMLDDGGVGPNMATHLSEWVGRLITRLEG